MTFDPRSLHGWWLADYAPELIEAERGRFGPIDEMARALGAGGRRASVHAVPIPLDCTDGFTEAYYGRPERFLEPGVTRAQSAWAFVAPGTLERFCARLRADLADGTWDRRHGALRAQPTFTGALRLVVSVPA
jgi:hypothetical protein